MTTHYSNWHRRHPIAVYLILANGITWLFWIPPLILASKQGYLLPTLANFAKLAESGFTSAQHAVVSTIFFLAVYGPLIAAIIVTALETGKPGLTKMFNRIIKWRVGVQWYLAVVVIAFALPLVPFGIGALLDIVSWNSNRIAVFLPYLLPMMLYQLLTSGLGEEPGWRGYLLPKLQTRYKGEKPLWLAGLFWAVWHYPVTAYITLSQMVDVPIVGMVFTIIFSLAGQTMTLIGMTYIYAWLCNNTKSVFIPILFHALGNMISTVLIVESQPLLTTMVALMPWAIVIILQRVYGKERFPGKPSP